MAGILKSKQCIDCGWSFRLIGNHVSPEGNPPRVQMEHFKRQLVNSVEIRPLHNPVVFFWKGKLKGRIGSPLDWNIERLIGIGRWQLPLEAAIKKGHANSHWICKCSSACRWVSIWVWGLPIHRFLIAMHFLRSHELRVFSFGCDYRFVKVR